MALRRKPHIFSWTEVDESKSGFRVDVPTESSPRAIRCQITPTTAEAIARNYGIEIVNGHLMLCELSDGRRLAYGDRGTFNGRKFQVAAAPKLWEAGLSTDHAEVLLEGVDF